MKANISKSTINLGPPKKETKKEPRKDKLEEKNVFAVYRPAKSISKKVQQIKEEEKKMSVRERYIKAKEDKSKEEGMEVDDAEGKVYPGEDINTDAKVEDNVKVDDKSWVGGGDWVKEKSAKSESAPDEVKMDERDSNFLSQAKFKEIFEPHLKKNSSLKEFVDWRLGLQDMGISLKNLTENSEMKFQKKDFSYWTQAANKDFFGFLKLLHSSGLASVGNQISNSRDMLEYLISDVIDASKSGKDLKEQDLKQFIPKKPQEVLNAGFISVLIALIREADLLREQFQFLFLSIEDYIKEALNRKWKADQRVYQIERVMENWIKNEEELPLPSRKKDVKREEWEKKRDEKRTKLREENIAKYKNEKTWIEEDKWKEMLPGERTLLRWKFSDQHQVMDRKSWMSLSKEQKSKFLEEKSKWREKRGKEIDEEIKTNPAKGLLTKRLFNFYNFRYKNNYGTFSADGWRVQNFRFRTLKSKKKKETK